MKKDFFVENRFFLSINFSEKKNASNKPVNGGEKSKMTKVLFCEVQKANCENSKKFFAKF